jgi:two-component system CheB/CheR fusion protein
MVGNDLRVRRFTPQAEKVLSLIPSDTGRPIGNIRPNINIPNLEQLLAEVIETLRTHEAEVQDVHGRWYLLRIRPYRTEENKIQGAVVALVDIDQLKRSLEDIREARDFNQSIIETVRAPLLVLDSEFRVRMANPAFYHTFELTPAEVADHLFFDMGGGQWKLPRLRSLTEELLPKTGRVDDFEVEHEFPRIGRRVLLFNARRFHLGPERDEMLLLAVEDVTERKQSEATLLRAREELERRVKERTAQLQSASESLKSQMADRERIQRALEQSEGAVRVNREELRALTASLFAAHEEERRRISRELHDALNQKLAMLEIEVDSLEHEPPSSPEKIREQLALLRGRVSEVSNEIRRMAYQLHPSVLDDLGLQVALRSHVSELSKRDGLEITFHARGIPDSLPQDVALSLYRIAQEALRNVMKHAHAKSASVALEKVKDGIRLSVRDHGVGFDPEAIKGKRGLGLVSIEERVRLLSGQLHLHSRPGDGTQVEVTIPIPARDGTAP